MFLDVGEVVGTKVANRDQKVLLVWLAIKRHTSESQYFSTGRAHGVEELFDEFHALIIGFSLVIGVYGAKSGHYRCRRCRAERTMAR